MDTTFWEQINQLVATIEIKILMGCTEEEMLTIERFLNVGGQWAMFMRVTKGIVT